MLRYRINTSSLKDDLVEVAVSNIAVNNINLGFDKAIYVTISYDNDIVVSNGDTLIVYNTETVIYSNQREYTIENGKEYVIEEVNYENHTFSFTADCRIYLDTEIVRLLSSNEEVTENGETTHRIIDYLYFYFNQTHHFSPYDDDIAIYVNDVKVNCEYVDSFSLRCELDKNMTIYDTIFLTEYDRMVKMAYISNDVISVEQYLFKNGDDNTRYYIGKHQTKINIPLTSMFNIDLQNDSTVREDFILVQEEKAIPGITDMEKDIYHPVIHYSYFDGEKDAEKIIPINTIRINFHFRQHRGSEWTVNQENSWNGVNKITRVPNTDSYVIEYQDFYFSYKRKDDQSDLIKYLDFGNDDVFYQRNRLKKSFIRLMFYDSMDPMRQNLIYYSTVFFDSGNLCTKYLKNVSNESLDYCDVNVTKFDGVNNDIIGLLKGIRVSREPYGLSSSKTDEEIEQYRLSTQIRISDRHSNTTSADGFYLYLWKDNNTTIPTDIYMKCEFNHAGYGRILPMMMPFKNNGGYNDNITTFDNIVIDTMDGTINGDTDGQNKGYTLEEYMKYSYIHFKYKYDVETKQHIYYLDDEFYKMGKNSTHFENDTLTLNLYEANAR